MTLERTHAPFQTTHWTLLSGLHSADPEARKAALDVLIRRYWPAVYSWLRCKGFEREEAAETVQHFFAEVVLARDLFGRSEAANGKLRSLVLVALQHFLVDRHRRRVARSEHVVLSLGDLSAEERIVHGTAAATPDEAYDRRWAVVVLEEALARCEEQLTRNGRHGHWAVFHARVVAPARSGCDARPLTDLAAEEGFASAADAAAAVQVVKRRVLMLLREVAGETASEDQQDDEYRRVVALLT